MAASVKPKQNKTAAFHVSDSCISSFLVFLENSSFHIERNRGKQLLCEVYCLISRIR